MKPWIIPTHYYQQFDADYSLEHPAEGYGGWKCADLPIQPDRTAIVMMHVCDCGTRDEYPGWFNSVEYLERSYRIAKEVLKPLVSAARTSGAIKVIHVPYDKRYVTGLPGYERVCRMSPDTPDRLEKADEDEVLFQLRSFRSNQVYPGERNLEDVLQGVERMSFVDGLEPLKDELITASSEQLFAICKAQGINHLIYTGFAINMCLLMSPGGMLDMSRRGILCSAVRQGVTAVENRETAATEMAKEVELWRVALSFGFLYDADDLISLLASDGQMQQSGVS
ncbi:hypothetical protein [Paenibacillus nasutitermitis]|uniref:Isochorismatase family protein n=1 Tax=Paenibacillus nasutitermitis TaxID=1652958 RepID=A0A916YMT4_9BACL|nr:hypothetical protein [Paenibacillus nasutitermitis]GGD52832.1 hypothetical protein GCM10010911_08000 [Paenibacillus nasutitermitis]